MRAGVYTRLSAPKATEELTDLGMGRQSEDTLKLAAARDYEVVKTYADPGVSAADDIVRGQFEQALQDLTTGTIEVLVIPRFDRLTRGLYTWLRIERVLLATGRIIVSVADGDLDPSTPSGKLILRQRAQMAEYELDMIRARVTRWHRQRAEAGKPLVSGRRPFGYATKDRSEVDEHEASTIREAARMVLNGRSLRSVVTWVNERATTPTGKPWNRQNFRQVLLSPGIAGLRSYKGGEPVVGVWEPIVARETWEAVGKVLTDRPASKGRPTMYLLSGFMTCGVCRLPMHTTRRYRDSVRQFSCETKGCGLSIKAEPVEELVTALVLGHLAGPGLDAALAALARPGVDIEALRRELREAEDARDEIEAMFKARKIKSDAFLRMHGPAELEVVRLREVLATAMRRSVLTELPSGRDELHTWWVGADLDDRRELLGATMYRVLIGPSGPRLNQWDANRLRPPFGPIWKR